MTDHDLDPAFTKIQRRAASVGGTWVSGTINDEYRFEALVFADHADSEEYELADSKISKLWIQRIADKQIMFNFDRGLDVPAVNTEIQVVVDFLCVGLADSVYAE